MQELKHMVAFREVTRSGSFSEASRRLNVTPASISRSIAKLEDDLGTRLVNRTTRRLHLTDEGRTYLEVIGPALDALNDAQSIINDQKGDARGLVRIALPVTFGRVQVLPALAEFLDRHPGLEVEIVFDDLTPDLTARSLDLALQFGEPCESSYIVRKLYVAPVYLVASPAYLERHPAPRTPDDLLGHFCMPVQMGHGPSFWTLVRTSDGSDGRTFAVGPLRGRLLIYDEYDTLYNAAKDGLGIITADLSMIKDDLENGSLKVVLPDHCVKMPFPRCDVLSLITPHRNHVPLRVQLVKEFLIERARKNMQDLVDPFDYAA